MLNENTEGNNWPGIKRGYIIQKKSARKQDHSGQGNKTMAKM